MSITKFWVFWGFDSRVNESGESFHCASMEKISGKFPFVVSSCGTKGFSNAHINILCFIIILAYFHKSSLSYIQVNYLSIYIFFLYYENKWEKKVILLKSWFSDLDQIVWSNPVNYELLIIPVFLILRTFLCEKCMEPLKL